MRALTKAKKAPPPELNLFITDTLGNPFVEEEQLPQIVEAIAKSRREANKVKREQPITVVIGNPPYKEKAEGRGGWIEKGAGGKLHAPLDRWKAPAEWGVGAHGKHLKNLYVYFWRWATLKVFGSGRFAATGVPDTDEEGIVCFITVAGFLNGPGFEKMRDDLRRTCSDIWVIDCSPGRPPAGRADAHLPGRAAAGLHRARGAQARKGRAEAGACAVSRAAEGQAGGKVQGARGAVARREGLDRLSYATGARPSCRSSAANGRISRRSRAMFDYNGSGVMPGRTWIIAPDKETLENRWERLIAEKGCRDERKCCFIRTAQGGRTEETSTFPTTSISQAAAAGLAGHEFRGMSVAKDTGEVIARCVTHSAASTGSGSFRMHRLINQPNPTLWKAWSDKQVFVTALEAASPKSGPALSLAALDPGPPSLQRLVRRPRLSALGRRAGDAIERARRRVAGAGQGARRAGRARRRDRLSSPP